MSDRQHDEKSASEMKDILASFDPQSRDDDLARALMEESVEAVRTQPCTVVSPDTSVQSALELLVDNEIACLLVSEDEGLSGIFTKRDVLDKVALWYDELKDQPVSEVMTRNPSYVFETDPVAAALCVMAGGGYRHVPVLDGNYKIAGVVGPRRLTTFLSQYFAGG